MGGGCGGGNVWGKCQGGGGNVCEKMSGEKGLGGMSGGRNVGIPKINSHLLERHKQSMFVMQSSVQLLKFS